MSENPRQPAPATRPARRRPYPRTLWSDTSSEDENPHRRHPRQPDAQRRALRRIGPRRPRRDPVGAQAIERYLRTERRTRRTEIRIMVEERTLVHQRLQALEDARTPEERQRQADEDARNRAEDEQREDEERDRRNLGPVELMFLEIEEAEELRIHRAPLREAALARRAEARAAVHAQREAAIVARERAEAERRAMVSKNKNNDQ